MPARWDRRFLVSQARWALGAFWLAWILWAFLNGPRLHAEAAQQTFRETEAENQEACGRLDMPPRSSRYAVCISTLDGVRRSQDARADQLNGLP